MSIVKLLLLQPAQLTTYLVEKYVIDIAPISKVTPHTFYLWTVPAFFPGWSFGGFCLRVKFYSYPLSESPQRHASKYCGWRDLPVHVSRQKRFPDHSPKGWSHARLPHCTAAAVQVNTTGFRGQSRGGQHLRGILTKLFRTQLSTLGDRQSF